MFELTITQLFYRKMSIARNGEVTQSVPIASQASLP